MMKKMILLSVIIILSGSATATKIIPLNLFKPFRIRCDGEKLYIGQEAVIYIYSAKDFNLLTKFGKPGEGPQEFKLFPEFSPDFDVQTETIVAFSLGKVSLFTKDGKFIGEKKILDSGRGQFYRKMGDGFVGEKFIRDKDNLLYKAVFIFDANLEKVKEIFRNKLNFQFGKQYSPIERGLYIPNFFIYYNKIFIGGQLDSGIVHVFDTNGNPLYNIQPQLDKVKFTEADKKGYIDSFSLYPDQYERLKNQFKYPDYFPLWQNFMVANDRIYFQTYKRNKEDTKNEVVIYNLKGELIKSVWLPFDEYFDFTPSPYIIHNKILYQCVDNEDEDRWELHITEIN
jgi:hypothetical protein